MEHRNVTHVPRHRLGNCDPGPNPRIAVADHNRHRTRRVLREAPMRITKTPTPVHGFIKQILGLSGTWMIQQAETGEIVIMPITHLAICKDCSANVGAIGEWCMLQNSVWQNAHEA